MNVVITVDSPGEYGWDWKVVIIPGRASQPKTDSILCDSLHTLNLFL